MHPTSLAKMTDVILAPGHLNTAKALEDLSSTLDFICFLIYRGWGKYGWEGRNLPRNVRGLLAEHKLILCDLR